MDNYYIFFSKEKLILSFEKLIAILRKNLLYIHYVEADQSK